MTPATFPRISVAMGASPSSYPVPLYLLDTAQAEGTVQASIAGYSELPAAEGTKEAPVLPTEFQLFPAGEFETTKGTFLFDAAAAESVMKRWQDWGNRYPVDYGHAMVDEKPVDPAESGKAAGWFDLQVRDGALWAVHVEWTPKGAEFLCQREYRHHSPAFKAEEKTRRITELVNTALTNLPATKGQQPLVASRTGEPPPQELHTMDPKTLTVLLSALQLQESASEAEALGVVMALKGVRTELYALTGKPDTTEALREIRAWQKASIELKVVRAELEKAQESSKAEKVEQLVTAALETGKLIPAQVDWAKDYGEKDLAGLEKFLEGAQPIVTLADRKPSRERAAKAHKSAELSKEDRAIAAMIGVDLKKLAKHKARKLLEDDEEAALLEEDDEDTEDDDEGAKKTRKAKKAKKLAGAKCDDDGDDD